MTVGQIIFLIFIVGVYVFYKISLKAESEKDENTKYSEEDIIGVFNTEDSGITRLRIGYKKTQQNKKRFILENYKQGKEVQDKNGYKYVMSKCIDEEYYYSDGGERCGPYVLYEVISAQEKNSGGIRIENVSAPVQIATNGSVANQNIYGNSFNNKIIEYRDIMIKNGIPKEDIENIITNDKDIGKKESFLRKHAFDLASIMISLSGNAISLLDYLKR